MVQTILIGASGNPYVFEDRPADDLPDVPGFIMLADILDHQPGASVTMSPTIGFVISLKLHAEKAVEEERRSVTHQSRALYCALTDRDPALRAAWADLKAGGATPFPSKINTEPFGPA